MFSAGSLGRAILLKLDFISPTADVETLRYVDHRTGFCERQWVPLWATVQQRGSNSHILSYIQYYSRLGFCSSRVCFVTLTCEWD